jgi:hypothetical protein
MGITETMAQGRHMALQRFLHRSFSLQDLDTDNQDVLFHGGDLRVKLPHLSSKGVIAALKRE